MAKTLSAAFPQRARKFKKVQAKKNSWNQINQKNFFREIAFLAILNLFCSSKIDFCPFLKFCRMENGEVSQVGVLGSTTHTNHSGPENVKKSRQKNSWNQINPNFFFVKLHFWRVLNFFPVQKLIFGHFWNWKNGIWST